jgi:hypothetical protein
MILIVICLYANFKVEIRNLISLVILRGTTVLRLKIPYKWNISASIIYQHELCAGYSKRKTARLQPWSLMKFHEVFWSSCYSSFVKSFEVLKSTDFPLGVFIDQSLNDAHTFDSKGIWQLGMFRHQLLKAAILPLFHWELECWFEWNRILSIAQQRLKKWKHTLFWKPK